MISKWSKSAVRKSNKTVAEVVSVTWSDKKEIKGKYWRKWLTVRLRGRRRSRDTQRERQGMDGEHEV